MWRLLLLSVLFFSTLTTNHAQTIWEGTRTTIVKEPNADPADAANQDRITENVWITRAATMGFYNAKTETGYTNFISPTDTEWSFGTTEDIATLNFQPWQTAINSNPPASIGKDMVMHLISDDIYIDFKLLQWSAGGGGGGGFSYERTTDNVAGVRDINLSASVSAFPNPAFTNQLSINYSSTDFTNPDIVIYDVTGREVGFTSVSQNRGSSSIQLTGTVTGLLTLVLREDRSFAAIRVLRF